MVKNVTKSCWPGYIFKSGHCISYDEVLAIETLWGRQLMSNEDGYATLPSNIQSSDCCLVQAIADNDDYGQEENSPNITNIVFGKVTIFYRRKLF